MTVEVWGGWVGDEALQRVCESVFTRPIASCLWRVWQLCTAGRVFAICVIRRVFG